MRANVDGGRCADLVTRFRLRLRKSSNHFECKLVTSRVRHSAWRETRSRSVELRQCPCCQCVGCQFGHYENIWLIFENLYTSCVSERTNQAQRLGRVSRRTPNLCASTKRLPRNCTQKLEPEFQQQSFFLSLSLSLCKIVLFRQIISAACATIHLIPGSATELQLPFFFASHYSVCSFESRFRNGNQQQHESGLKRPATWRTHSSAQNDFDCSLAETLSEPGRTLLFNVFKLLPDRRSVYKKIVTLKLDCKIINSSAIGLQPDRAFTSIVHSVRARFRFRGGATK